MSCGWEYIAAACFILYIRGGYEGELASRFPDGFAASTVADLKFERPQEHEKFGKKKIYRIKHRFVLPIQKISVLF